MHSCAYTETGLCELPSPNNIQHEGMGQVSRSDRFEPGTSPMSRLTTVHIDHRQIRFLADPDLRFTKALDLAFDGAAIFGGDRSKRYALVTENGAVKDAHVEADNTGLKGML